MNKAKHILAVIVAFALVGLPAVVSAQQPYRRTEQQVKNLLQRIEHNSDRFRKSLNDALDKSRIDGTRAEDNINQFIKDFEEATDRLKGRFDDDNAATATVHEVLRRAARIDAFMRQHRLTLGAQNDWRGLRNSLDQLASAYRVSWRWY